MAVTDKFDFAGASTAYAGRLRSDGLFAGWANISADAASSGVRRMRGIQTAPNPLTQPTRKQIKGDNKRQRTYLFQNDADANGNYEFSQSDLTFEMAAIGGTYWDLGNWRIVVRGSSAPQFSNIFLVVHSDATDADTGQAGFMNIVSPNCQFLPTGHDAQAYQAEGKFVYAATVNPFLESFMGNDLLLANNGVSDGLQYAWFSVHPVLFHAKIGDATWTTIVVDGKPIDTAGTKAYGTTSLGVTSAKTVSSVTPGTNTITLSAAPASGELVVVAYESSTLP